MSKFGGAIALEALPDEVELGLGRGKPLKDAVDGWNASNTYKKTLIPELISKF